MTAKTIMNIDLVTVATWDVLTKIGVVLLTAPSAPNTGGIHPDRDLAGGEEGS